MFGRKFLEDPARADLREEYRRHLLANDRIGITRAVQGVIDRQGVYGELDRIRVPTLILVGDSDGEVPMEQSVEWWHALEAMKVPTKFVVYAHEGHMFIKPEHQADRLDETVGWFDRYLK